MFNFDVTDGMLQAWKELGDPLATTADIAFIESKLDIKLPAAYEAFVRQYGFVHFGRDVPERRCLFSYIIEANAQRVTRQREVRFMYKPAKLVPRYRYLTTTDDPDDETRPSIPQGYLPVAGDAAYGAVLLDIAEHPGQVWSGLTATIAGASATTSRLDSSRTTSRISSTH